MYYFDHFHFYSHSINKGVTINKLEITFFFPCTYFVNIKVTLSNGAV